MSAPEDFVAAYEEAAMWSSTDNSREDGGDPLDNGTYELSEKTRAVMRKDCDTFFDANGMLLALATCKRGTGQYSKNAQAGHDFWLTRNGHGAGFWDGDWSKPHGEALTAACKKFREFYLYVGDDGKVYGE